MDNHLSSNSRLMHVIRVIAINLTLSAMVVMTAALALRIDRLWPAGLPRHLEPAAWPLLILGTLLILASAYTLLVRSGASGAPGDPTLQLVTTGPYRWMRNPIYAGAALLLFGVAFFSRSPTLLLFALAFLPVIHMFVLLVEEPRTERRFGDEYVNYKRNVPRWIPRPLKQEDNSREGNDQAT